MLTVMMRDSAEFGEADNVSVKEMLAKSSTRLADTLDTSTKSADLILALFDLFVNLEDPAGADALIRKAMEPRGCGQAAKNRSQAVIIAARLLFMSAAPRP